MVMARLDAILTQSLRKKKQKKEKKKKISPQTPFIKKKKIKKKKNEKLTLLCHRLRSMTWRQTSTSKNWLNISIT